MTTLLIVAALLVATALVAHSCGRSSAIRGSGEEVSRLRAEIAVKQKALDALTAEIAGKEIVINQKERRYQDLKTQIRQKAVEAQKITLPEGTDETVRRFNALGYRPRVSE